jgi:integrase
MASIVNDPNGRKRICFFNPVGERKTIRLGKMTKQQAATVKLRIELLVGAKINGTAPDDDTSRWVASIGDKLHDKLAGQGLVAPRAKAQRITLAAFIDGYIASRSDLQANTLKNLRNSRNRLVSYFEAERDITTITPGDADEWRQSIVNTGLAAATVSKAVKQAKQFFRFAHRKGLIATNPLQDLRAGGERNDDRLCFIERDTIQKVIEHCPDAQWKLIVALSRYGGLRCPSEHLALRWGDVDWERSRLTVPSGKTTRRVIPLFPELRPYLECVFDQADQGAEHVITRYRDTNSNLRTQLLRIIRRAGVEPWERLFHNLRASRQTELADQFPAHVVARWLGNSPAIAERHYLQTIEAHYERAIRPVEAAQNPAQSGTVMPRNKGATTVAPGAITGDYDGLRNCTCVQIVREGFEPPTKGL